MLGFLLFVLNRCRYLLLGCRVSPHGEPMRLDGNGRTKPDAQAHRVKSK
jgi:hypothetical protein